MRRTFFVAVLIVSLGANAWFLARHSETPPAQPGPKQPTTPPSAPTPTTLATFTSPKTLEDYRTLQARLLREGYTQDFTQKIVTALLQDEWSRRLKALKPPGKYWRHTRHGYANDEDGAISRLHAEMEKIAFDLGAPTRFADPSFALREQDRFGDLSPEKVSQLKRIEADYAYLQQRLGSTEETQLQLLQRERQADIARILSPAELREYDYRTSDAGTRLRGTLDKFEATEAEFVALYPKLEALLLMDVKDEDEAIDAIMKQTLGEARYAQFQEINDRDLQTTHAFVAATNLPRQTAYDVAAVEREFATRRRDVQWNRDLSDNQRVQKLKELGAEELERLQLILGPHAETYWRLHGNR